MISKITLVILLFLMWGAGSGWYYITEIKEVYPTEKEETTVDIPFGFEKSSTLLILGKNYATVQEEVLSQLDSSNKLVIIGQYSSDELNNSMYEDLGKGRAYEVQQQLGIDQAIVLRSEQVALDWSQRLINGVRFEIEEVGPNLMEVEGGMALIIPANTVPEELPRDVEEYLYNLLEEHPDALIDIVGHSRDRGNAAFNITMGYNAAFIIRDWLINQGYNEELIGTASEGAANEQYAHMLSEGLAETIVEIYIR